MVTIIFIIININNRQKSSSSYWVSIAIWNSSRANRPHPHSLHLFVGMHPYCLALSSSSNVIIRIHKYSQVFTSIHTHSLHLFVGMHPYCSALSSSSSNVIIRIHAFITIVHRHIALLLGIVIVNFSHFHEHHMHKTMQQ